MSLPMLVAFISSLGVFRSVEGQQRSAEEQRRFGMRLLWIGAALVIGLALIFTRSRAGIACAVIAFALTYLVLGLRTGSRKARWVALVSLMVLLILAALVGLTPVIERFSELDELRGKFLASSFTAGIAYLPFGSGLGTYPDAHQPFQLDYPTWVNYAHNDYAQAFVESGLLAIAMIGLALVAFVTQWQRLLTYRFAHPIHLFQACAGVSVFALLLHSVVDFNLRIPANALFFAFLAGLFFRPVPLRPPKSSRRRSRNPNDPATTPE
jgi:O-antigen ligase